MTLREKLQARIDAEMVEIARIVNDAALNKAAAENRVVTLQRAAAVLDANPQIESLVDALHRMGVEI